MGWVPLREAVSEMMVVGAMVVGGLGVEGGRDGGGGWGVDILEGCAWGGVGGRWRGGREGGSEVLVWWGGGSVGSGWGWGQKVIELDGLKERLVGLQNVLG